MDCRNRKVEGCILAKNFHSGFVSIIGRPNVGKSTLMNLYIGEKIAIVSHKPQTTRNKIHAILTKDDFQIVFIDTPGLHTPKSKLGEYMVKSASGALSGVDVVLYMVEPYDKINDNDRNILERLAKVDASVFLVINKIDTVGKPHLLAVIDAYRALYDFAEIVPISAAKGENTDVLLGAVRKALPAGPKYFLDDMITDQPERQIAAEMIREKALVLLQEEIPHGVAVEIMSMKKRDGKNLIDMEVTLYCEKDSHKGMIIGKQGAMLKEIGKRARADIERFLGSPVYLQIWVKVKKNWRDNDFLMRNFGYDRKEI